MRREVSWAALAAVLLVSLPVKPARAIGVYEDAAGHAGFLTSPHVASIRAAMIRTDGDRRDASMFVVSASYPLRDNLLVQFEQPYVALMEPSDIASGFGDTGARARLRVAGGDGRALHLLGALRLGTGSKRYFPYSSQSFDMMIGVGYVDTLRAVQVWGSAGGVAVKREPEGFEEPRRHQNFARFVAGMTVSVLGAVSARGGVTALVFRSGAVREIFLAELCLRPSPSIELFAGAHAEAGDADERVSDAAATVGIAAHF